MALKPTIYKFKIAIADLNREVYQSSNFTLAQHPSETPERMMARVLAYCLDVEEFLTFTKGLSDLDEPDIWAKSLDNQILLWIDIGEPSAERIKKSTSLSQRTKIYSFNSKSDVWWSQGQDKFNKLNATILRFNWKNIQELAKLVERSMSLSVTITGNSAYITADKGECEVHWETLNSP